MVHKDLLIIKFQRQQFLIEIYSGHIEISAQDCKNKDIIPLYNARLLLCIKIFLSLNFKDSNV